MKTEDSTPRTLDDVVFDHRNKDYGAYEIRRSYSKNLVTGLGITISAICVMTIIPHVFDLFGSKSDPIVTIDRPGGKVITIGGPVNIEQQQPAAASIAPASNQTTNLPPKVTTDPEPVENKDFKPDAPTTNTSNGTEYAGMDDPGPGGAGTGTEGGTGTGEGSELLPAPNSGPVDFAEVMPEYEGGQTEMMRFIVNHMHYPGVAQRQQVQGTVYVTFVVNGEGRVTDVKVTRGISAECDKEAMRVVSMMKKWKAGRQNHRAVSVRMTLPIKFHLQEL